MVKKYDIMIPKQDYVKIEVAILDTEGSPTKLGETDTIYFTVKRNAEAEGNEFQKSLNNGITYNEETSKYEIEIQSNDTKNMNMGDVSGVYGYDITVYYGGTKPKQKVIGKFIISDKYTLNEVV